MDDKTSKIWTLPEDDPAEALAPIRRLVLIAFVVALIAGMLLISSTLHVMWTTDALSMSEERIRIISARRASPSQIRRYREG